jgi:hypothetical protein
MAELDPGVVETLRTLRSLGLNRTPVSSDQIAVARQLHVEEIKLQLAEAHANNLVWYVNAVEGTTLPTEAGWELLPAGEDLLEASDSD